MTVRPSRVPPWSQRSQSPEGERLLMRPRAALARPRPGARLSYRRRLAW
jgi:hypothetical protein